MKEEENEMVGQYFRKDHEGVTWSEEEVMRKLDRVDPTLVGGAKMRGLLGVGSRFVVEALTYLLEAPEDLEEEVVVVTRTSGIRYRGCC